MKNAGIITCCVILPKSRPPVASASSKKEIEKFRWYTQPLHLPPNLTKCLEEEEEASAGVEVCIYLLLTAFE
jgi:hypothetical protein